MRPKVSTGPPSGGAPWVFRQLDAGSEDVPDRRVPDRGLKIVDDLQASLEPQGIVFTLFPCKTLANSESLVLPPVQEPI